MDNISISLCFFSIKKKLIISSLVINYYLALPLTHYIVILCKHIYIYSVKDQCVLNLIFGAFVLDELIY